MPPTPATGASANTTSVQVAVRIRPANSHDAASIPTRFQRQVVHGSSTAVTVDPSSTPAASSSAPTPAASSSSSAASNPLAKKQTFSFDHVHPQQATQLDVYSNTAAPLVSRFLTGFNCTILAYGQTSSGKTYTMTGVDLDSDPSVAAEADNGMGIIPRSVASIFTQVSQLKHERGAGWSCTLKGSFIEIYNEDLIDLLAPEDPTLRREVQIREEKDGTIIWSGLKEVPVRSTSEVMSLLRQGSSIRRTNETDMNAQSSRSHAIFSLTLTQKKWSGTGPGPMAGRSGRTSPMPPGATPSPSRLARPSSVQISSSASRVGSPTFGRPPTPSFASAMRRAGEGSVSLRPQSVMALRPGTPDQEEESGSWITVVSKFHFVDLAGSERLKRTAAQGDRIKEGISINSGLLALGNVISALGDPSRSRSLGANVHVPYRDSKLTRLLQDSLGGNAHTVMIACVSPAEWNAAETVNTLKYANRARNIKNRAEVKEREEGWDDLEWLQGMVTKLRKDLKAMKEGGVVPGAEGAGAGPGAAKMMHKYQELQAMHEELRARYTQANDDLRKTKEQLDDRPLMSPTTANDKVGSIKRYEEIVAPVIEQYEKTIVAMEAELKLNRTALAHTNEMYDEQEVELEQLKERHSTTELYVEELRARVTKLVERETSTESYVRDLEIKLKTFTDATTTSSESLIELKKEIAHHKDREASTSSYITNLETRLAQSDADVLSLRAAVEKLEADLEAKSHEVKKLEAKVDALLAAHASGNASASADLEAWRQTLDERERKVAELETKMAEWEKVRASVGSERRRLGDIVEGQEREKRMLEDALTASPASANVRLPLTLDVPQANRGLPTLRVGGSPSNEADIPLPPSPVESISSTADADTLRDQLLSLQETHSGTLQDLSSVTFKYRDALREISDLASQISEVKLQLSQQTPSQSTFGLDGDSDSGAVTPRSTRGSPVSGTVALGSARRRRTRDGVAPLAINGAGGPARKLFFRHAASAESLHSRSQSQSLSQELSRAPSSRDTWSTGDSLLSPTLAPKSPMRMSLQLPGERKRSVEGLEKEIMRLQEVLKEREAEIGMLEKSLDSFERSRSTRASSPSFRITSDVLDERDELESEESIASNGAPLAPNGNHPPRSLSPATREKFAELRKSLEIAPDSHLSATPFGGEDSLQRLNELMRSMALKESHHKEIVEDLNEQLVAIRKQHEELTALSRDQANNMSAELEALRVQLRTSPNDKVAISAQINNLDRREKAVLGEIQAANDAHGPAMDTLKSKHDAEVERLRKEHELALSRISDEHEDALQYGIAKARREAEVTTAAQLEANLATVKSEHEVSVAHLIEDHENELRKHEMEVESILARTRADHERTVARIRAEHEEALRTRDTEASSVADQKKAEELAAEHKANLAQVQEAHQKEILMTSSSSTDLLTRLQEEHDEHLRTLEGRQNQLLAAAKEEHSATLLKTQQENEEIIVKLRAESEDALARKSTEFELLLQRMKDEHAAELRQAEIARQGGLSESQQATADAMKQLQEEHTAALDRRDVSAKEDLERLRVEHERVWTSKAAEHQSLVDKLKTEHAAILMALEENTTQKAKDLEAKMADVQRARIESETTFANQVAKSQQDLAEGLAGSAKAHEESIAQLKAQHQIAMTEVQAALIAAGEASRLQLEEVRAQHEKTLAAEQERHLVAMAGLETLQKSERETLIKAHDLLADELQLHKDALTQASGDREQDRASHESELESLKSQVTSMQHNLSLITSERDDHTLTIQNIRAELESSNALQNSYKQDASEAKALAQELNQQQTAFGEVQAELLRLKEEKESHLQERQRQDALIQDLQAQLSRSKAHKRDGSGDSAPNSASTNSIGSRLTRPNGIPSAKLPPLSAPPAGPPPPPPSTTADSSVLSHTTRTSSSSQGSRPASPADTSVIMSPTPAHEAKLAALIEEQAMHIQEQEAMIKTLNKQLTHCEADLQAHMDLVATLEASLTDSERNLRKFRLQSTEMAKERDSYQQQMAGLRIQVSEAQREASNMRRSVAEEKLSLEHRLDEERKAKERARAQLDSRMEEMSKRKSKFVCM